MSATQIIVKNGKAFSPVTTNLYSGWVHNSSIEVLNKEPELLWKGSKIPFAVWAEIVCFLRWTQVTYKEEAMVILFYHTTEGRWAAWPFPQEPNGMTIKLLPDHPLYATDRAQFGRGWIQAGSVHHHCTAGAFQSGTDAHDEADRDGLHITLGKMTEPVLDFHVRQVFDGLQSSPSLSSWIELPEWFSSIPKYMATSEVAKHAVLGVADLPFPEVWKSRIIERPKTNVYTGTPVSLTLREKEVIRNYQNRGKKNDTAHVTETPSVGSTNGSETGVTKTVHDFRGTWKEKCEECLMHICTEMHINLWEAQALLSSFESEGMDPSDVIIRRELIAMLEAAHIPKLYAESILDDLTLDEAKSSRTISH